MLAATRRTHWYCSAGLMRSDLVTALVYGVFYFVTMFLGCSCSDHLSLSAGRVPLHIFYVYHDHSGGLLVYNRVIFFVHPSRKHLHHGLSVYHPLVIFPCCCPLLLFCLPSRFHVCFYLPLSFLVRALLSSLSLSPCSLFSLLSFCVRKAKEIPLCLCNLHHLHHHHCRHYYLILLVVSSGRKGLISTRLLLPACSCVRACVLLSLPACLPACLGWLF